MKLNGTPMFKTLAAAETQANKMNVDSGTPWAKSYVATQVYDGEGGTGFGVMNLGDRSVYGVKGEYVKGTSWDQ